jgi:hypothetical protein
MPRLTKSDKVWLAKHYPGLNCIERSDGSLIEGRLDFTGSYDGIEITDSYHIRLLLSESASGLPVITETRGRLARVLKSHPEFGGRWVELHVYPKRKQLCLAAPQELRLRYLTKPTAPRLFSDYVVPYFYSQSYFEKNGTWPWNHLPHDSFGVVEWYLDNSTMAGAAKETIDALKRLAESGHARAQKIVARAMKHDSFSPRNKCLCGSNKSFQQCHRQLTKLALAFRNAEHRCGQY